MSERSVAVKDDHFRLLRFRSSATHESRRGRIKGDKLRFDAIRVAVPERGVDVGFGIESRIAFS